MNRLRAEFRVMGCGQHGPYFSGYCGKHESEHPGIVQLAGASLADRGLCFSHGFQPSLQSYPKDCFRYPLLKMLMPVAVLVWMKKAVK